MSSSPAFAWPRLPAKQQPKWPDEGRRHRAVTTLASLPPLVFAGECDALVRGIAEASQGRAFILMGGDCAETFVTATAANIRDRLKTLLQMAAVLTYGASTPIIKVGRMAGQYAKPRSRDTEVRGDVELPSYRGDMVNGVGFTEEERIPDPERLVHAYHASAATLNLVRAFCQGGFGDLRQVQEWNRGFTSNPAYSRYEHLARDIDKAMRFMAACGADFEAMRRTDVWAGHEALVLDYEYPLTRVDSRTGQPYAMSGHFVWAGERTRDLGGAHIDFLARVNNPVGVKIGPGAKPEDVIALAKAVNPQGIPGRLSFISRMGASTVRTALPPLLQACVDEGIAAAWICDPMHGNTFESSGGFKTRRFSDIVDEVEGFFAAHHAVGLPPAGLHVELTGNDVTECVGGASSVEDADLARRYETACDPRLNHQQSLELAFVVAQMLAASVGCATPG